MLRILTPVLIGAGTLWVSGCSSISMTSPEDQATAKIKFAEAIGALSDAEFGEWEELSAHPKLEVRTKVGNQRVQSAPLKQSDGRSLSSSEGVGIGYPAALELKNSDTIDIEITDLEIRRRTQHVFGYYANFLSSEPILIKPSEIWEGLFIVSRKEGWYRVEATATAPQGWSPILGRGTRNVYYQEETNPKLGFNGYGVTVTFWNLRETDVSFRYWITNEKPSGVPKDWVTNGVMDLKSGEAKKIELETEKKSWNLVTAPPSGDS